MRKEFLLDMKGGRKAVLYAGLLDLAHQSGLKVLRTELLALPTPENGHTAISMATVILERDGREMTFTGIGDASPRNVAPGMVNCLMRMAETRAKARALRDAVNVGVIAFEELGGEEDVEEKPLKRSAPRPAPVKPSDDSAMSATQRKAIGNLCTKTGEPLPNGLETFTNFRAAQEIKRLSTLRQEKRAG